jgi:hypothetical protein
MVYFLLAKALFSPDPYREVLRKLTETARRDGQTGKGWHVPDKAAVFRARQHVGVDPLRELLAQVGPMASETTPGAFWRGWHLVVIDGTTLEVADSVANDKVFGRPGRTRGHGPAGYRQARVMAVIESGTHVVTDAEIGSFTIAERRLAEGLIRSLRPGMLLLADRGFPSVWLWKQMAATGADLVWRVSKAWKLQPEEILSDGSWISTVSMGHGRRADWVRVRVIEYRLDDAGRDSKQRYRLITTILDPSAAPVVEVAALYAERWEAETTLAEWKTTQVGAGNVLTSKSPELVCQEIYAHLAVHAGLRALMCRVATDLDDPIDPDRLSFIAALRAARRSVVSLSSAFSLSV